MLTRTYERTCLREMTVERKKRKGTKESRCYFFGGYWRIAVIIPISNRGRGSFLLYPSLVCSARVSSFSN